MKSFDAQWVETQGRGGEDFFTDRPRTQNELMYAHRARQLLGELRRLLGDRRLRTLEVGCGRGTVSAYLAAAGHEPTLLDASEAALELARANLERHGLAASYVRGDAAALPCEDGSFDFVFSLGLLEHFDDPRAIVAEKFRVCAPGGVVWDEVVPAKASAQSLAAPLTEAQWLAHRGRARLSGRAPRERHHRTRVNAREVEALYAPHAARVESFGALPVPNLPLPDGSAGGRAGFALQRALMAARERMFDDPWRCSTAWGQSFVVYGVKR